MLQDSQLLPEREILSDGGFDTCTDIAVDDFGDILITGTFRRAADFDPSDGVDLHFATGMVKDILTD